MINQPRREKGKNVKNGSDCFEQYVYNLLYKFPIIIMINQYKKMNSVHFIFSKTLAVIRLKAI